jgi:DNA-binding beta-propeller fold protein YncE
MPVAAAGLVIVLLVVVSLVILVNLYNTTDQVGLKADPTAVPSTMSTQAPFVAPATVPLTATAVLAGGSGPPARLLDPREALRLSDGRVFVADTGNHRVAILDRRGNYAGAITQGERGPLQTPFSLALTSDGTIVVLDSDAGQVLEYSPSGKLLRASDPALSLSRARGIALDPAGRVLVADPASDAVDTLGPDLALVHQQPALVPGKDALFNQPSAVSAGADGTIYVVDSQNNRVEQFTSDWQLLKLWSIAASDTLHSPRVVSLSGGRILVSDPRYDRLLLFGPDSNIPQAFSVVGPDGPGVTPQGLTVERNGLVLVTCGGSNQVLEVRLPTN